MKLILEGNKLSDNGKFGMSRDCFTSYKTPGNGFFWMLYPEVFWLGDKDLITADRRG